MQAQGAADELRVQDLAADLIDDDEQQDHGDGGPDRAVDVCWADEGDEDGRDRSDVGPKTGMSEATTTNRPIISHGPMPMTRQPSAAAAPMISAMIS